MSSMHVFTILLAMSTSTAHEERRLLSRRYLKGKSGAMSLDEYLAQWGGIDKKMETPYPDWDKIQPINTEGYHWFKNDWSNYKGSKITPTNIQWIDYSDPNVYNPMHPHYGGGGSNSVIVLQNPIFSAEKLEEQARPNNFGSPSDWAEDRISPSLCMCQLNYAPVCGEDGNSYSNSCFAHCKNVKIVHFGECGHEDEYKKFVEDAAKFNVHKAAAYGLEGQVPVSDFNPSIRADEVRFDSVSVQEKSTKNSGNDAPTKAVPGVGVVLLAFGISLTVIAVFAVAVIVGILIVRTRKVTQTDHSSRRPAARTESAAVEV